MDTIAITGKGLLEMKSMLKETEMSVVLPVYNEQDTIIKVLDSLYYQKDDTGYLDRKKYEIIIVDNNSTDNTIKLITQYASGHPDFIISIAREKNQGVAWARKTGMDIASYRSRQRDKSYNKKGNFYIYSGDADCIVDEKWIWELYKQMNKTNAAIGICNYYYPENYFRDKPYLWEAIDKIMRLRFITFSLFGGFPDGKGFAVQREKYDKIGGIEIFYQLKNGQFVNHLSDDWDFGIRMVSFGEKITYAHYSRVEINPRRVTCAINEIINGIAYGQDGIITMKNIRTGEERNKLEGDVSKVEAQLAWEYAIKDFVPKNTILPVLLNHNFFKEKTVIDFFSKELAQRLEKRIYEIKKEMRILDFRPIHLYKTPSYRLYFEFAGEIFARLRAAAGDDIGYPPPLPSCLQEVLAVNPGKFHDFVHYYCEDRESGEAHNYFGNGGVF
ncbi:MAG: glycosyltransferase family 2 protein [Spirochaetales bacterium]|nr:glycosyltransferase family 2 protein [Spirochaetales bacterium]